MSSPLRPSTPSLVSNQVTKLNSWYFPSKCLASTETPLPLTMIFKKTETPFKLVLNTKGFVYFL